MINNIKNNLEIFYQLKEKEMNIIPSFFEKNFINSSEFKDFFEKELFVDEKLKIGFLFSPNLPKVINKINSQTMYKNLVEADSIFPGLLRKKQTFEDVLKVLDLASKTGVTLWTNPTSEYWTYSTKVIQKDELKPTIKFFEKILKAKENKTLNENIWENYQKTISTQTLLRSNEMIWNAISISLFSLKNQKTGKYSNSPLLVKSQKLIQFNELNLISPSGMKLINRFINSDIFIPFENWIEDICKNMTKEEEEKVVKQIRRLARYSTDEFEKATEEEKEKMIEKIRNNFKAFFEDFYPIVARKSWDEYDSFENFLKKDGKTN